MKTLLLHVPKLEDYYLPFGRYMNVNYMAMGLPAICNHLVSAGHDASIIHAGVEKILSPEWSIDAELDDPGLEAAGLSLQWHYQAYDTKRAVEKIKRKRPDIFVFLGGLTASYFGTELLEAVPEADAVIIGEGFEPARLLLDALESGGDLSTVPNLAWRNGSRIIVNETGYLHPPSFFDNLEFADLTRLRNHSVYIEQFGFPLAYSLDLTREENRRQMTMGRAFFPLFAGSGCPRSCTYCGGNAKTQAKIFGSHRILWRPVSRVIEDIKRASSFGYKTMALCFDPAPESVNYYTGLFGRMRDEVPDVDLYFECWSLPEPAFIDAFAAAFNPPHSYIALSPDTGSEKLRRKHKGYYYSDEDLYNTMDLLEKRGIQTDLFFSIGFPGETESLALETREMIRILADRYGNIRRLMTWAVQLEPGSPMYEEPEKWGIIPGRSSLVDFFKAHGDRGDTYSVLGYGIPGFFGLEGSAAGESGRIEAFEVRFQQFKCREFCFFSPDPVVYNEPGLGRAGCLAKRKELALRHGMPVPSKPVSNELSYSEAVRAERPARERAEV